LRASRAAAQRSYTLTLEPVLFEGFLAAAERNYTLTLEPVLFEGFLAAPATLHYTFTGEVVGYSFCLPVFSPVTNNGEPSTWADAATVSGVWASVANPGEPSVWSGGSVVSTSWTPATVAGGSWVTVSCCDC
jgi:hypothetical protein